MTTVSDYPYKMDSRCEICGRRFGNHHKFLNQSCEEYLCDHPSGDGKPLSNKRFTLQVFDYGEEELSMFSLIEPYVVPLAR